MKEKIKQEILSKVKEYYRASTEDKFEDKINYAGRIFDEDEMVNLIDSSLEFWLTSGRYTEQFERDLSEFLNVSPEFLLYKDVDDKNIEFNNNGQMIRKFYRYSNSYDRFKNVIEKEFLKLNEDEKIKFLEKAEIYLCK